MNPHRGGNQGAGLNMKSFNKLAPYGLMMPTSLAGNSGIIMGADEQKNEILFNYILPSQLY